MWLDFEVGVCQTTDRATPYTYPRELLAIGDLVRLSPGVPLSLGVS